MDGDLVDSAPAAHVTTPTGTPTYGAGNDGQAIALSGTGQYATTPHASDLNLTTAVTMAAWIKPTKTAGATQYLIKKAINGNTNGYELSLATTGFAFFRVNQFTSANTFRVDATTPHPLNGSAWIARCRHIRRLEHPPVHQWRPGGHEARSGLHRHQHSGARHRR